MRSILLSVVSQATPFFPRIGGVACETSAASTSKCVGILRGVAEEVFG